MKKILFFGTFLLMIAFHTKAQEEVDYTTFFHEGVRWTSGEYDARKNIIRSDDHYEIKGDSTIGENCYNRIYWNNKLIALVRNEAGSIYLRLLKGERELPHELWFAGYDGTLHKDYLLHTFTNRWEIDTPLAYTRLENALKEPFKDTIREEFLDTIQLANGKYYKQYKDMIYGFGHYLKGPLGFLVYERMWEGGYCLVELYDHDELVYRTTEYHFSGLNNTGEDRAIQVSYSPAEKTLRVNTTLPEGNYTVDLFRMDGIKALSFSAASRTLEDLPRGIYIVRIRTHAASLYESKIRVE